MEYKNNIYCGNCGLAGHKFRKCNMPITSYGIIAIRKWKNDKLSKNIDNILRKSKNYISPPPGLNNIERYCLIERKDTMGYIDIIRGRYPMDNEKEKDRMLKILFNEITNEEKDNLKTLEFDELWDNLWVDHKSKCYKTDYELTKKRYKSLNINYYLSNIDTDWRFTEWGFPKGRRNLKETDLECAIREFCEETGYKDSDFRLLNDNKSLVEEFLGSNGVKYRHVYYIAEIFKEAKNAKIDMNNTTQISEVKNIGWLTYQECMQIFRSYNVEKKRVLTELHNMKLI